MFLLVMLYLLAIEVILYLIVRSCRKVFPWLITKDDELPALDEKALTKFLDYSFDPDLGWVRKPNTTGTEHGRNREIQFHIDATGSRLHSRSNLVPKIASFGDSYTFCRQVMDDETWQAILAKDKALGVLNYGVGNYGVDQALLRYEMMPLPTSVGVVLMGFVPETICRIQSYWKHYLEFGNTFAFKPRFTLGENGEVKLQKNLIRSFSDFQHLESILPYIRQHDVFYESKFRRLQFRFPYILSFSRHPLRHSKIILAVVVRSLLRIFRIKNDMVESLPFTLIMKENIRHAHALYQDKKSTDLLKAILLRFKEIAKSRNQIPLVVVMPQLMDMKLIRNTRIPYEDFFQGLNSEMNVINLTEIFLKQRSLDSLYVNDKYGGHLSHKGNSLVSQEISRLLDELVKLN